jgi:glycosyltransferase involved in cell wall biosynthesis
VKIVIVNEGLGYPPNRGNWLRTVNLLLPLARRHEITYLCRGSDDESAEKARSFYAEHGIRSLIVGDPAPANRGLSFYGRLGRNVLSPLPYSVAVHRSPSVRREIRRIAREEQVDVWQFESISYADSLSGREARTIVVAHNVESLIWQRLHETEVNPVRRWYVGHQWRKYERCESRMLNGASQVVSVSEEDASLMHNRFGVRHAAVIENGVDVEFFSATQRNHVDPRRILFVGSLDWRPNLDCVNILLDQILPAVTRAEPRARLSVVGRNPPESLRRRIDAHPNAELHADVPDVRPYLANAAMLAVPLRIGGGSRLKILEAMAAGVPVVSTSVGCEGLIFQAGRELTVVNDVSEMAAALVRVIRHPEHAWALAQNAKVVVQAHYDWNRLANQLEEVWYHCAYARAGESWSPAIARSAIGTAYANERPASGAAV